MKLLKHWLNFFKPRKRGKPKYVVMTEPGTAENAFMESWLDKWKKQLTYLSVSGCGCETCSIHYVFDGPSEIVDEIPLDLIQSYGELHRPLRSGNPSSFREFNRIAEDIASQARNKTS